MRLSNDYVYSRVQWHLNQNLSRIMTTQEQIDTGKTFMVASDNPAAAINSMKIRNSMAVNDFYIKRQGHIQPYLEIASSSLTTVSEVIRKIRTDLNYANSSTLTGEDQRIIADNIDSQLDLVMFSMNNDYNNTYLFGGQNIDRVPFERVGDKVYYRGTENVVEQEINQGINSKVTHVGTDIFERHTVTGKTGIGSADNVLNTVIVPPGGNRFSIQQGDDGSPIEFVVDYATDTLQDVADRINLSSSLDVNAYVKEDQGLNYLVLQSEILGSAGELFILDDIDDAGGAGEGFLNLMQIADSTDITGTESSFKYGFFDTIYGITQDLRNGQIGGISDSMEKVDEIYERVLSYQFTISHDVTRIESAQSYAEEEQFRLERLLSDTEDLDMIQAVTQLSNQQNAYQAALQTSARILQMSMLNYI